jgi:chemotaxis protein CheX
MIQVPVNYGKPRLNEQREAIYDIGCIIGLSGDVSGSVVISLSKLVALELASGLTGEECKELDEDCLDALGEIANMIVGNARKDFPGAETRITVPNVIVGRHKIAYPQKLPIITIPCDTPAGRLAVEVALKEIVKKEPAAASAE